MSQVLAMQLTSELATFGLGDAVVSTSELVAATPVLEKASGWILLVPDGPLLLLPWGDAMLPGSSEERLLLLEMPHLHLVVSCLLIKHVKLPVKQ